MKFNIMEEETNCVDNSISSFVLLLIILEKWLNGKMIEMIRLISSIFKN